MRCERLVSANLAFHCRSNAWNRYHVLQCKRCAVFKHKSVETPFLEKVILGRFLGCLKINECIHKNKWEDALKMADILHMQYRAYIEMRPFAPGGASIRRYFSCLKEARDFVHELIKYCPKGLYCPIYIYAIMPPEFEAKYIASFYRTAICMRHYVSLCQTTKDIVNKMAVNETPESMKRFLSSNDAVNLLTDKRRGEAEGSGANGLWYAVVMKPSKDFVIHC